jgi:hypothetical protein
VRHLVTWIPQFEMFTSSVPLSQNDVSKFLNISFKGIPLGFAVKSCKNFQNTPVFIFLKKKYKFFQIFRQEYFCKFH